MLIVKHLKKRLNRGSNEVSISLFLLDSRDLRLENARFLALLTKINRSSKFGTIVCYYVPCAPA